MDLTDDLNDDKKQVSFKILLIGDIGTGKTSIMNRLVHNKFVVHYKSTIGVDFAVHTINKNDMTIKLQFWDLAGQERFGSQTRIYYANASGGFIVFDITRNSTFEGLKKWKIDLDNKAKLDNTDEPIPVILIANKIDMYENLDGDEYDDKKYCGKNEEDMDRFCKEFGFVGWFPVSAKNNTNIKEAVDSLVDVVLENEKRFAIEESDSSNENKKNVDLNKVEAKGGCCF